MRYQLTAKDKEDMRRLVVRYGVRGANRFHDAGLTPISTTGRAADFIEVLTDQVQQAEKKLRK